MAHYAKVVDGVVVTVIVAEPEFFETFVDSSPGKWLQCSYNTRNGIHYQPDSNDPSSDQSKALRKNYPGIGYTYNEQLDGFIRPKPFPSWILNEQTCNWNAPVPVPEENPESYEWDEETVNWKLIERY
jgi:hypothetical protein